MTGVLIRRNLATQRLRGHREGRRPCDNKSRMWNDAAASQGMAGIADNHQNPGERHGTHSPLSPQKEVSPTDTLISNFWPPEL